MKVFIVDDEPATIEIICTYLNEFFPTIELLGFAHSVKDSVTSISSLKPDLVLLDIELTDGTGFDVVKSFESPFFRVIFITAFDQFAVQAFRFSAVDYILKPINPIEFRDAVSKARKDIGDKGNQLELMTLLHNISSNSKLEKRIVLRTSDDIHLINTSEVVRIESDGAYSHFLLQSGKRVTVSQNIKHFEEALLNLGFFRCHQSHIVNVTYINRYHKSEGGMLILKDGSTVPVSFRKKDSLFKLFEQYGIG
ncbi:MAG TPA: LytTR family DNA-binding domain-containing protein [Tenuifilaceae bacterium]|nr:LytTR family DNA-binding domain-containing protein [Tenuifilaceae bacterium]HRX67685.1 LytTR family DNA-binding domain-containing protein [Tenuifilaceae bacterium]